MKTDGFYIVRMVEEPYDRVFSVCVIHGHPRYVEAEDSDPIPWDKLENGEGLWEPAQLIIRGD